MPTNLETVYVPIVYALYAAASAVITVLLARTLSSNGRVFLERVFDSDFSTAVNRLLVIGFYLVNFGYALKQLSGGYATNLQSAIEMLSGKLGGLLITLAVMHFANLFVLHMIGRSKRRLSMPAPLEAHGRIDPIEAPAAA